MVHESKARSVNVRGVVAYTKNILMCDSTYAYGCTRNLKQVFIKHVSALKGHKHIQYDWDPMASIQRVNTIDG